PVCLSVCNLSVTCLSVTCLSVTCLSVSNLSVSNLSVCLSVYNLSVCNLSVYLSVICLSVTCVSVSNLFVSNLSVCVSRWSSSGGSTVTWSDQETLVVTVTFTCSRRGSSPCGRYPYYYYSNTTAGTTVFQQYSDTVSSPRTSSNRSGGKWIIRLRKGLASRFWENIILAMLGEQFMVGEEICGAVVSIRFQEDILSIWNRTSNDQTTTSRIRDTLRRVLNLPANTIMEYKTHNDSLRDNSSFRNTKISL
uniref:Eukaryotic translation initiation factor 4E family member 2 related sequence 1 n=1 Tax=Amphiprion percula TaxID=161767 RepID=A0A3P8U2Y7_AMPPE